MEIKKMETKKKKSRKPIEKGWNKRVENSQQKSPLIEGDFLSL